MIQAEQHNNRAKVPRSSIDINNAQYRVQRNISTDPMHGEPRPCASHVQLRHRIAGYWGRVGHAIAPAAPYRYWKQSNASI